MMVRTFALFGFLAALGLAQSGAPSFEVASVKLVAAPKLPPFLPEGNRMSGGPGTKIPGKFECKEVSLKSLLARAYNVPAARVVGPDWLGTARYNVEARLDTDTTPANFRLMLQGLLTERFSIRLHHETKSTAVYVLTVAKNGPKLQPMQKGPVFENNADRKSALQASMQKNMEATKVRMAAGDAHSFSTFRVSGSMSRFVETLNGYTDREVIDRTGVEGDHQFELSWTSDPNATSEASLFVAIQEQLGFKLQAAKEDLEILTIDRAERIPTGN
jgi:uncharacterized protein (TIGR03435 family)